MRKIPYASAVGSLMYAMVCTRQYIAHLVGFVSIFLSNPRKQHWEAVKWILRYLKGTIHHCLCFGDNIVLEGFIDADMASDVDSRKSTTIYLYTFAGATVSWVSKIQKSSGSLHNRGKIYGCNKVLKINVVDGTNPR